MAHATGFRRRRQRPTWSCMHTTALEYQISLCIQQFYDHCTCQLTFRFREECHWLYIIPQRWRNLDNDQGCAHRIPLHVEFKFLTIHYSGDNMSTTDQKFEEAKKEIKTITTNPSVDDRLGLYGLFKQATLGDAKGSRPWVTNMTVCHRLKNVVCMYNMCLTERFWSCDNICNHSACRNLTSYKFNVWMYVCTALYDFKDSLLVCLFSFLSVHIYTFPSMYTQAICKYYRMYPSIHPSINSFIYSYIPTFLHCIVYQQRAKWDAWNANKGMSNEAAKVKYVEMVAELMEQ